MESVWNAVLKVRFIVLFCIFLQGVFRAFSFAFWFLRKIFFQIPELFQIFRFFSLQLSLYGTLHSLFENGRFSLASELLILLLGNPPVISNLKMLPELFRKILAFIRFGNYNYTVILQADAGTNCDRSANYEILNHRTNHRTPGHLYLPYSDFVRQETRSPYWFCLGNSSGHRNASDARIKNVKYIKKPAESEQWAVDRIIDSNLKIGCFLPLAVANERINLSSQIYLNRRFDRLW